MSATAFQLRRREAAAARIVARLGTATQRRQFAEVARLSDAAASAETLYHAVAAHTDPPALLALAEDIIAPRRRRSRRRKTETMT